MQLRSLLLYITMIMAYINVRKFRGLFQVSLIIIILFIRENNGVKHRCIHDTIRVRWKYACSYTYPAIYSYMYSYSYLQKRFYLINDRNKLDCMHAWKNNNSLVSPLYILIVLIVPVCTQNTH